MYYLALYFWKRKNMLREVKQFLQSHIVSCGTGIYTQLSQILKSSHFPPREKLITLPVPQAEILESL